MSQSRIGRLAMWHSSFWAAALVCFVSLASFAVPAGAQSPTRNVVVITIDGLRWQEMFTGADSAYFKKDKDGRPTATEKRFMRPSADERRAVLMPFMWGGVAKEGQIFGDPSRNSRAHITNGLWFSYPGYNEMFSGAADPRIDSNDKIPNPNVTVLEWLNTRPGFEGKVAAFGAWDVLPFIVNTGRSRVPVGSGFVPVPSDKDRSPARDQRAGPGPAALLGLRDVRCADRRRGDREPPHRQTARAVRDAW